MSHTFSRVKQKNKKQNKKKTTEKQQQQHCVYVSRTYDLKVKIC